ncbi:MAG: class I SAM-dependent methyltransferase [Bacteroidia bacterium]|nr:class I SAM-dependent methyltransferase [Bacteroidia bacterium]
MTIQLISPQNFPDYELLDVGDFVKLERFGKYITIRPEPQAVWSPAWNRKEWEKLAHVEFVPKSSSTGVWKRFKEMPDRWNISYPFSETEHIKLRLALTGFKHVGVFPEQACNWNYIYQSIKAQKTDKPKFLNLFAYTGAASLAAASAGAQVTHCDSIKQVVTWANDNMKLSNLDGVRWMIEDAMKFVKREIRRGNLYNGIILDPPAYGHGPNGESWKLEENINEMVGDVCKLLDPSEHFLVLNTYSLGFSSVILENLFQNRMPAKANPEFGELFLQSKSGLKLPLGVWGRWNFQKNK